MKIEEAFPNIKDLHHDVIPLIEVAVRAASLASQIHQDHIRDNYAVSRKDLNDIVTEVDLKAEKAIFDEIKRVFPQHGLKSEETNDSSAVSEYQWVIDPLDGTINYAAGIPFYSASIAVQKSGETLAGVIAVGATNGLYVAVRGHGAFFNGTRISSSDRKSLHDSVLSFMLTSHYTPEQQADIFARLAVISPRVRGLRLYVSQALELALIASGHLDGHICIKSRGYSAAAGVLLLREARGRVTDLAGITFSNASRSLVASNGHLHEEILSSMS